MLLKSVFALTCIFSAFGASLDSKEDQRIRKQLVNVLNERDALDRKTQKLAEQWDRHCKSQGKLVGTVQQVCVDPPKPEPPKSEPVKPANGGK